MDSKTRRIEINQITLGTGVIWFSLWFAIRSALTLFVFNGDINIEGEFVFKVAVYVVLAIIIGTVCLLHFYIGNSARKEGRGKRKSIAYLVITVITLIIYISSIVFGISVLFDGSEDIISTIVTFVIDLTTIICLVEIMINSARLRSIRKNSPQEKTVISTENGGAA